MAEIPLVNLAAPAKLALPTGFLHVLGQFIIRRANRPGDEGDRALAGHCRADRLARWVGQNQNRGPGEHSGVAQTARGNHEHRHWLRDRHSALLIRPHRGSGGGIWKIDKRN